MGPEQTHRDNENILFLAPILLHIRLPYIFCILDGFKS